MEKEFRELKNEEPICNECEYKSGLDRFKIELIVNDISSNRASLYMYMTDAGMIAGHIHAKTIVDLRKMVSDVGGILKNISMF